MKLVSINRAQKQSIEFSGQRVETGLFKAPVSETVFLGTLGIEGDVIVDTSVHGGVDQAVYLYSLEDYQWWTEKLARELPPGMFGENLTTAGIDLRTLVIGDRLMIGNVILEISAPRTPCFKLAVRMGDKHFAKQFVSASRPGAYARVLREGDICAGDPVMLVKTTADYAGVVEVFDLWHEKQRCPQLIYKALESPISAYHRSVIQGWSVVGE
ncbi:Protein YiiM [Zhongshania aliphaticivorans]|uniref:Protein YiiM n=1 Tax=Zhongshania aliphaticivorans TaxID=1470434 RepID=A0A5S9NNQ6_9GAMM|nr:MOSC domain-containing protein [Zhongshania aliphaticivorans]CAA0092014.1 Protein YiiM [Zhongshania aliphaticivorans]CAA0099349.1 Protein YiiM [Zhongshania aliphaticivorans]